MRGDCIFWIPKAQVVYCRFLRYIVLDIVGQEKLYPSTNRVEAGHLNSSKEMEMNQPGILNYRSFVISALFSILFLGTNYAKDKII